MLRETLLVLFGALLGVGMLALFALFCDSDPDEDDYL
jgi:hypothetical protein